MQPETIPALLKARAKDAAILDAVVEPGARIGYADLDENSLRRAAWLVAQGVNKGHRVGLLMENGIDWVVNALAVMRIGGVLVPLSTFLKSGELASQLATAGVRHLIVTDEYRGRDYRQEIARLDRGSLPSLHNIWDRAALRDNDEEAERALALALGNRVVPADEMVVIFTSGSSQAPRGIVHTHGSALRATFAGLEVRCIRADTRLYIPMPFFWIGGFGGGLISALCAGATLLTEAVPEPGATLEFIAREGVTLFRGWPDQAIRLAQRPEFPASDLSALTPASLDAVLPPDLRSLPGRRANLFGMTESFGPYCGWPLDRDMPEEKWGSCGQVFPGIRLRIVDPDTGQPLPDGNKGVIQIGGKNILQAICGREREAVFTPDGWFDTRDLGSLDSEGYLWFHGRADDMVKVKGISVFPAEVETAIKQIPGVAEAFVTAIAVGGFAAIGAAVAMQPGQKLDANDLASAAHERLSSFKIPARWLIVPSFADLPRIASGKIDRRAMQAMLEQEFANA